MNQMSILKAGMALAGGFFIARAAHSDVLVPVTTTTTLPTSGYVVTEPENGVAIIQPVKQITFVEWKKWSGTVLSVDRSNKTIRLLDDNGNTIQIVFDDYTQAYRRGQSINYTSIEPNDRITIKYDKNHS